MTSYGIENFDFHAGLAWGNLNDRENSFKNPLSYFSDNFLNRPTQFEDKGGQFQPSRYFSDETAALFYGFTYALNEKTLFKFERDTTDTPGLVGYKKSSSKFSFGIDRTINDNFNIIGSSYEGIADKENIVGNWWNHKILTTNSQISPLSGSVKEQEVIFISKETLKIGNKSFEVDHFKLKSTNEELEEDKKLDFDIWLDSKKNIIIKVEYNRLGKWQYILKNVE